jgi:hypothetical protein
MARTGSVGHAASEFSCLASGASERLIQYERTGVHQCQALYFVADDRAVEFIEGSM